MENNFKQLLEATLAHLPEKKYLVKKTRQNRFTRQDEDYFVPSKNVILSLAFNMAFKNYEEFRGTRKITPLNLIQVSDLLLRFFSNKYYKKIDDVNDSELVDLNQNYNFQITKSFRDIEFKLFKAVELFRNYHSHYIHDPSILSFENYLDELETQKNGGKKKANLTSDEFEDVKNWIKYRFDDARDHLKHSFAKKSPENRKNIDEVKGKLSKLDFLYNKNISYDGQMFFACMFLNKRQAKVVLNKWFDYQLADYEHSLNTFFTYFCLKESYSINNYHDYLLKFRDILAKLTNFPYHSNPGLQPIYSVIDKKNKAVNEEAELIEAQIIDQKSAIIRTVGNAKMKLKAELDILKEDKKTLLKKIIPYRKKSFLTSALLGYIIDNKLLTPEFKVAIKKSPVDIEEYYELNGDDLRDDEGNNISLNALKDKIKAADTKEIRIRLLNHFKELKRNFVFVSASEMYNWNEIDYFETETYEDSDTETKNLSLSGSKPVDYRFTVKEKNALFHYTNTKTGDTINLHFSPQLLIKWVFAHLHGSGKKKNEGLEKIKSVVDDYMEKVSSGKTSSEIVADFSKNLNLHYLQPSKVFSSSILKNQQDEPVNSSEQITNNLVLRLNRLKNFVDENNRTARPFKFKAKEKIDLIFEYLNFRLLFDVYQMGKARNQNISETDFIRHNSFSVDNYNIAREYFRYYGRYADLSILEIDQKAYKKVGMLKSQYKLIFSYIKHAEQSSRSLEQLFSIIMNEYITRLTEFKKQVPNDSNKMKILKMDAVSVTGHVNDLIKGKFYLHNLCLHPDIINLKTMFPGEWRDFALKFETCKNKFFSEYAFIRNELQNLDNVKTNIDFFYKEIYKDTFDKKLPTAVARNLQKMKTEELILWNVAKFYWKKASGAEYISNWDGDMESPVFQEFCSFNKAYTKDLQYPITIDQNFWNSERGRNRKRFDVLLNQHKNLSSETLTFTIQVPARRYDNRFLAVEKKLIEEYCLWNCYHEGKITLEDNHFDKIMHLIYAQLRKSLEIISNLLAAEKLLIDKERDFIRKKLAEKYNENTELTSFFLSFNEISGLFVNLGIQSQQILENVRNAAMHYQLQDPEIINPINQTLTQKIIPADIDLTQFIDKTKKPK